MDILSTTVTKSLKFSIEMDKITEAEKEKFLGRQCYYQFYDGTWMGGSHRAVFTVDGVSADGCLFNLYNDTFKCVQASPKHLHLIAQSSVEWSNDVKQKEYFKNEKESLDTLQSKLDSLKTNLEYIADYLENLNKEFDDNDDEVLDLMNK